MASVLRAYRAIGRWPPAVQCAGLIVISSLLMVLQLAIVKMIADGVPVFEIVLFRGLFGALAMAPLLVRGGGIHLRPNRPGLIWLTGSLAFLAAVLFYLSAKHLPIADITAIHLSRPICAALVAAVVLDEALRRNRLLAIGLGLVGAAIVIRPDQVAFNIGVVYVLGVVAVQSWNPINRKLLAMSEHPDTVAVWNVLTIIPFGLVATVFVWTPPSFGQLGWMAVIGLLELLNQRVLARAYVRGAAMAVVGLQYTRLPIAAVVGYALFGEAPAIWVWIGAAVIALAAVILARGEGASGAKQPR